MTFSDRYRITYANAIHPRHLTPRERLSAVCEILARGIVRLRLRERELSAVERDSGLHFSPTESGDATDQGENV